MKINCSAIWAIAFVLIFSVVFLFFVTFDIDESSGYLQNTTIIGLENDLETYCKYQWSNIDYCIVMWDNSSNYLKCDTYFYNATTLWGLIHINYLKDIKRAHLKSTVLITEY